MIPIEAFAAALRRCGVDFFTGVPCSYMKAFVSYANASADLPYVAAASEGEAVGLAAGAYLAGKLPMVLLQNSGLGNCVNPLTSLVKTFDMPMLLMVSHRGEGGADAPQHELMGAITYALLETMRIPVHRLPAEADAAAALLANACERARTGMEPVALVVPKGTFAPYDYAEPPAPRRAQGPMPEEPAGEADAPLAPRFDALRAVLDALRDPDLVVSTTGMTSRELYAAGDRPGTFYMMGSMGCAPAVALGVCLNRPDRKVMVIDGDGAFLMKMGTAATIGHYAPPGLLHVVLDNGTYETTGGQPTVSSTVAFDRVAHAVGYKTARAVSGPDALRRAVADFRVGDGPALCHLRIADGHLPDVPRVGRTPHEIRDAFRAAVLGGVEVA